ncbi:HAD family hydrolase [Mycoplasmopsis agassizii]|uniref:HAD family hydrolase n=1 Tax=Mycoplasmopsis agassizii TaxID=33922 RepID=UPI00352965CA
MHIDDFTTFIFDLDGTLLNKKGEIPEKNLEIIEELMEQKKHIILATGRSVNLINSYIETTKTNMPIISVNGALIKSPSTGEIIYEDFIDKKTAKAIYKLAHELGIYICIYTSKGAIFNKNPRQTSNPIFIRELEYIDLTKDATIEYVVDNFDQLDQHDIIKFNLFVEQISAKTFYLFRQELENMSDDLNHFFSSLWNYEVMKNSSSKGKGIQILHDLGIIDLATTIVFGDETNDISSAQSGAVFVAMANSNPELLKHTEIVTKKTNDEAGIAYFIKKEMEW